MKGLDFNSKIEEYQKGFKEIYNEIIETKEIETTLEEIYLELEWEHKKLELSYYDRY